MEGIDLPSELPLSSLELSELPSTDLKKFSYTKDFIIIFTSSFPDTSPKISTLFCQEYTIWHTLFHIHEVEKPLAIESLWSSYDHSQMDRLLSLCLR